MKIIKPKTVEILVDCPEALGDVVVVYDRGLPSELRFAFPPHVMVECAATQCVAAADIANRPSQMRELHAAQEDSIPLMILNQPGLQ